MTDDDDCQLYSAMFSFDEKDDFMILMNAPSTVPSASNTKSNSKRTDSTKTRECNNCCQLHFAPLILSLKKFAYAKLKWETHSRILPVGVFVYYRC